MAAFLASAVFLNFKRGKIIQFLENLNQIIPAVLPWYGNIKFEMTVISYSLMDPTITPETKNFWTNG